MLALFFTSFFCIFQSKIMSELVNNNVQIYQFPTSDETISEVNKGMNALLPFAVVGSNDFVKVGNKMVRARQYPWGVVQGKKREKDQNKINLQASTHKYILCVDACKLILF